MSATGREVRLVRAPSLEEPVDAPPGAVLVACPDCGRRHYCGFNCPESAEEEEEEEEEEADPAIERMVRKGF
jgi:hypothetical protein